MSAASKRIREQAVVYLGQRDRALLENLAKETGLSRTELFRRGLWALAAQTFGGKQSSAFEYLITTAVDADVPPDFSERSDEYLYAGKTSASADRQVAEEEPAAKKSPGRRPSKRARPR
jgi:hypothetical protein